MNPDDPVKVIKHNTILAAIGSKKLRAKHEIQKPFDKNLEMSKLPSTMEGVVGY